MWLLLPPNAPAADTARCLPPPLQVQHLDGRQLQLQLTEVVQPGATRRLPGEGMPNSKTGAKGDMWVTFEVELPRHLSPEAKRQLRSLLPAQ
jgi:DnaJ family protein B protein 4